MKKTIKKILLSSVSVLAVSTLLWLGLMLNPSLSYANQTQMGQVTVFHNQELEEGTTEVVNNAISIIKRSELYDKNLNIQLCLNDDDLYPHLWPLAGATAYAVFNKTIIYASTPSFDENITEYRWEVNNYESRKFNLTWLLAHEFTHNLQSHADLKYQSLSTLNGINWKLEGHAEYVSRQFKNDGLLRSKIDQYLLEESKEHVGLPVFDLDDGTKQILSYYKYALMVQFLMEEQGMDYAQICNLELGMDEVYKQMLEWKSDRR